MKKDTQDRLFFPLTYLAALWLKKVRANIRTMKRSRQILIKEGVFPILDRYWEPLFNPARLRHSLSDDRTLPGIDLNIKEQLELISKFSWSDELRRFPIHKTGATEFYCINGSFGPGDAEYLYNAIRYFKPKRMIEIGSGNSTLMAVNAIAANRREDVKYRCEHTCIEPYECEWLKGLDISLVRKPVEEVDAASFRALEANDILFIDSSHIIRPQGDVLLEYLEILPTLKSGVVVHVHDIFTPKDYPEGWLTDEVRFWNEQYLLEAFLSFNSRFKVIASLNHLKHRYFSNLTAACPILKDFPLTEPASFYLRVV